MHHLSNLPRVSPLMKGEEDPRRTEGHAPGLTPRIRATTHQPSRPIRQLRARHRLGTLRVKLIFPEE